MSIALGILIAIFHFLLSFWMRKRTFLTPGHPVLSTFFLFSSFLFRLLLLGILLFLLSQNSMIRFQSLLITLVISFTLLLPLELLQRREVEHIKK